MPCSDCALTNSPLQVWDLGIHVHGREALDDPSLGLLLPSALAELQPRRGRAGRLAHQQHELDGIRREGVGPHFAAFQAH